MAKAKQCYRDGYWWSNDGLRLHYRDYPARSGEDGRAPILCLPGLTRNARDFEGVAEWLSEDRRVICVDLRGRGGSAWAKDPLSYVPLTYVQDLDNLLQELDITQFVSIGTSLGGILTMLMASTMPGRIIGALLNDVGPEIDPAGLQRIREYVGQARSWPSWMHAARALAEVHGPIYPGFGLDDWLSMAKKNMKVDTTGRIVFDYDMKIAEPFAVPGSETGVDLWPCLQGLESCPVTLLRGELSDLFSQKTAEKMQQKLPDCAFVTIAGVGHAPSLDEPDSRSAIAELLQRVDASTVDA